MDILTENGVSQSFGHKRFFSLFLVCLVVISFLSLHFLLPTTIQGDGVSYVESMSVLTGTPPPTNFTPNRVLTTFAGLEIVIGLSHVTGGIMSAWIILNLFFYFVLSIVFYKLLRSVFESERVAFLGSLFIASNYAMVVFGLNYLMDIGGWTLYVVSLYYTWKYIQSHERKHILLSACAVGIGGLFKEYALLAFIPIVVVLGWEYRRNLPHFIVPMPRSSTVGIDMTGIGGGRFLYNIRALVQPTKILGALLRGLEGVTAFISHVIVPSLLAVGGLCVVYVTVYYRFHYTYLDWFTNNTVTYVYHSRIIEYIKSFGVLYNILALVCLAGLVTLSLSWQGVHHKIKLFLFAFGFSVLPILFWPAITERILFITIPFGILIASFFLKKYERYWPVFLLLLLIYTITTFFIDSVLLKVINLPI